MFFGVPRVWEKMYEKLQEIESRADPTTKTMTEWAKHQSLNYYYALSEGRELSKHEQDQFELAKKLVLNKVKAELGFSNTVGLSCGGAPMRPELQEYFMSLNLPITNGYGLSETLAIGTSSAFKAGQFRPGSVGKVVVPTIKIIDHKGSGNDSGREGEICFKGRNICMGYLNLPEKTNETILDDGWLLTGDLGRLDQDGFLFITGRVKELVITAGGENIPPVLIEDAIKKELPILANAMLIGDQRKYLAILLTVMCKAEDVTGAPLEALAPSVVTWCAERGLNITTVEDFRRETETNRHGKVASAVQEAIERYNSNHAISNAQKVQRWTFLPHDFTQVTGELNSTLKLKRSVAADMYADIIDALYGDNYPALDGDRSIKLKSKL